MVHRNTLPGRCIQRLSERQPSHNTKDAREALTELVFEQLQAPAYYLANQTVLSAFASGKGTALILDIGASHATATPVLDGFVLRKGIHRQPIGGSAITRALQWSISQPSALPNSPRLSPHHAIDIIPPYLIKSKTAVEAGSAPNYLLRQDRLNEARATPNELTRFHTDEYVDFLRMVTPETVAILTGDSARHLAGAGEDCPAFEGLWDFCSISAGGSIGAAHQI
ncbi:unnamed protein product, partial [Tilletia caries]